MKKNIIYLALFVVLGVMIAFWWQGSADLFHSGTSGIITAVGKLSGILAVYSILLQLLMRARIPFLENALGFETLNYLHKKNGYVIFTLILLHPTLLTIGYAKSAKTGLMQQFLDFLFNYDDVLKAFIAVLIFVAVVITSISIVHKKLKYELWYFVHITTYLAIFFAWGHQIFIGSDFTNKWFVYYWYFLYGATALSILYWRFFKLLYINYRHRFFLSDIKKETEDTYSLYIKGKDVQRFHFEPGQFVMIRFLTKNLWWESHPFSFSESPNGKYIRLTIKNSGDFTSKINKIKPHTPLFLDGPHGAFTLLHAKTNKLLYVAGGVGITPIRSMIEQAVQKKKDIILIYGNKTSKDIIFKKELDELSKKYKFPIYYVVSRDPKFKGLQGRVDVALIKKLIPDFQDRDIFICGPSKIPLTLQKHLLNEGFPKNQIHFEQFFL